MSATATAEPTLGRCPKWCRNRRDDGGHPSVHASEGHSLRTQRTFVVAYRGRRGLLGAPEYVGVEVDDGSHDRDDVAEPQEVLSLAPAEARSLAAMLVKVADSIELRS